MNQVAAACPEREITYSSVISVVNVRWWGLPERRAIPNAGWSPPGSEQLQLPDVLS
jgi:hypothetical protein